MPTEVATSLRKQKSFCAEGLCVHCRGYNKWLPSNRLRLLRRSTNQQWKLPRAGEPSAFHQADASHFWQPTKLAKSACAELTACLSAATAGCLGLVPRILDAGSISVRCQWHVQHQADFSRYSSTFHYACTQPMLHSAAARSELLTFCPAPAAARHAHQTA